MLFSYLQYNDPDSYIWIPLYFLVAVFVLLKDSYVLSLATLIASISAILFVQNIDLILTQSSNSIIQELPMKKHELFYELGGLLTIISILYFKLSKKI